MKTQMKKVVMAVIANALMVTGILSPVVDSYAAEGGLQPGEMRLEKKAEPVEGEVNSWKVTVTAKSKDVERPKDYILIVDRSKSMLYDENNTKNSEEKSNSRIVYARKAAKELVDGIYEADSRNRVAVLSFASAPTSQIEPDGKYKAGAEHTTLDIGLSEEKDKAAVNSAIDSIKDDRISGGTYTQLALHEAQELMEEAHRADTEGDRDRVIILLTDGTPTLATEVDWSKVPADQFTTTDIAENTCQTYRQLKYTSGANVGKLIYIDADTGDSTPNATSASGKPNAPRLGITYADPVTGGTTNGVGIPEDAFDYANAKLDTIGYGAAVPYGISDNKYNEKTVYANIMNLTVAEANIIREKKDVDGLYVIGYDVSAADSKGIEGIAGDKQHYVEAKGKGIGDAMQEILKRTAASTFLAKVSDQIPTGFTTPEDITVSTGSAKFENGIIQWDVGTPDKEVEGTNPVERYATLSYIIRVADDETFTEDNFFNTNGTTKVDYYDPNHPGNDEYKKTAEVDSPQVKVAKYVIKKTVPNGETGDSTFTMKVTSPSGLVRTIELKQNEEKIITHFYETGSYKVKEVVDANGYDVKYLIDGKETNEFSMITKAIDESQIVKIEVQNTVKKYNVNYKFECLDKSRELPDAVKAYLPQSQHDILNGTEVSAKEPEKPSVRVGEDVWTFIGYDANMKKIEGSDIEFVGVWSVKHDPPYEVTYQYISGTPGKDLPEEVKNLTPAKVTNLHEGDTTNAQAPAHNKVEVEVENGKWVFEGYNKSSVTIVDHDDQFTGTWKFIEEKHDVTYQYVSGTPGKDLPEEVIRLTPEGDKGIPYGTEVEAESPLRTEVPVEGGKWVFKSYDKKSATMEKEDIQFKGTWEFVEDTYKVTYEYVSGTPGKELPEEVKALTPVDVTGLKNGESTDVIQPNQTEVATEDGKWVFQAYDKETVTIDRADGKFTGTWTFVKNPQSQEDYKVTYEYVSGTPGKELPEEVKNLTPAMVTGLVNGSNVKATAPSRLEVKVKGGKWVFDIYENNSLTIKNADGKFVGIWKFVEDEDTVVLEQKNTTKKKNVVTKITIQEKQTKAPKTGDQMHVIAVGLAVIVSLSVVIGICLKKRKRD